MRNCRRPDAPPKKTTKLTGEIGYSGITFELLEEAKEEILQYLYEWEYDWKDSHIEDVLYGCWTTLNEFDIFNDDGWDITVANHHKEKCSCSPWCGTYTLKTLHLDIWFEPEELGPYCVLKEF